MPYVFQEYPKWVHRPDSKPVLVQDADEEAALPPIAPGKSTNMLVGETLKAGDHLTADQPMFNGQTEAVVATAVAPSDAPRRGGWPKGRKRNTSRVSVN